MPSMYLDSSLALSGTDFLTDDTMVSFIFEMFLQPGPKR